MLFSRHSRDIASSRLSLVTLLLAGMLAATASADLSATNEQRRQSAALAAEYESLVAQVERGLIAEALLKQKLHAAEANALLSDAENDNDNDNDAAQASDEAGNDAAHSEHRAKRFPKWRTGETRSRVKSLHHNSDLSSDAVSHHQAISSYDRPLMKVWQQNMREKNRMYQKMLG